MTTWAQNKQFNSQSTKQTGFTIVELLIVIIVIGILAALVLVSYSNINGQAKSATLQGDLTQAAKQLNLDKEQSGGGSFPATLAAANNGKGITASAGNTFSYFSNNAFPSGFCLQDTRDNLTYNIYSTGKTTSPATSGDCANAAGRQLWWSLNGNTNDSSPSGFNGTMANLTAVAGQNGQTNGAYSFNGSSSAITATSDVSLAPSSMTLSFWIKPTSWSAATAATFISKRTNSNDGIFIFYYNLTSSINVDTGGSATRWNTGYAPPTGSWTHIVITRSTGGRALYINGVLNGSTSGNGNEAALQASVPFVVGTDNGYTAAYSYNGALDDLREYNRVLSATEIQSLYTAGAQ